MFVLSPWLRALRQLFKSASSATPRLSLISSSRSASILASSLISAFRKRPRSQTGTSKNLWTYHPVNRGKKPAEISFSFVIWMRVTNLQQHIDQTSWDLQSKDLVSIFSTELPGERWNRARNKLRRHSHVSPVFKEIAIKAKSQLTLTIDNKV